MTKRAMISCCGCCWITYFSQYLCANPIWWIVACCGLAQGIDLSTTVAPFILRGVTLTGIDSVMASYDKRIATRNLLAYYRDEKLLSYISNTISLTKCVEAANKMIARQIQGRCVVDINKST
jgi:acrylyl-CoA reductase (NADPH)